MATDNVTHAGLVNTDTGEILLETPGLLAKYATPTGLDLPPDLDFEEWSAVGDVLTHIEKGVMWWVGDWWAYGEHAYGERAAQALELGRWSFQTFADAGWVARKIETSRRREVLPFSHHKEVAALPPAEADDLLDEAEAEGWSRAQMRSAVKHRRQRAEPAVGDADWSAVEGWHHCSVADLVKHVEPATVDVFVTDPPYPFEFLDVYADLSATAAKVLKPGGLCVAMAGQSYLPAVLEKMGEGGLRYHWTISYQTPGGQSVQLWDRNVNTFWKPVLIYANGTYQGDWFGDVARSDPNDNDKDHHHWGQSESGMADLLRRVSTPGDLICDPFLGGGTTAVVAAQLGRQVIGSDIDQSALDAARRRFTA